MVLVMMVLSPSRAIPPAVSGEPSRGNMTVTLTTMPQQPVRTAAVTPSARLEPPVLPKRSAAERRIHSLQSKTSARLPEEPAQQAAAQPTSPPDVAATASSAPVEILHPKFRLPPEPAIYPPRALELNQQGEVLVRAMIDCDGDPKAVEVARGSGFPMLDEAALKAVRRWRFVPAQIAGTTVVATVQVPVIFHLK